MGIIYNNNVKETEIMTAYGLTVYGKVNRYDWTFCEKESENVLITIRITDDTGKDKVNTYLGNNCIFQSNIDTTMDNFLYWISTENPDQYTIEDMIYDCLCSSNSLFNHRIFKARKTEENENFYKQQRKEKEAQFDKLKSYCKENDLFYSIDFKDEITILKAMTNHCRQAIAEAQETMNRKRMESYIEFAEKYPENNDLRIVKRTTLEDFIRSI